MTRRPDLPTVFRGHDAVEAGEVTPAALRGPRFRRVVRGVYTLSEVRITHALRCQAVALVAPPTAVITGASALNLLGARLGGPEDPVHVVVPLAQRFDLGRDVVVTRRHLVVHESVPWGEVRRATAVRAALDLVLGRMPVDAVPELDVALRAGLLDVDDLARVVSERSDRGIVRARECVDLADGRSESRPESWVRVVLAGAGLVPEPQHEVHDERGFVARVDLAFVAQRVAVEYEGEHHGQVSWLRKDRQRLDRLRQAGWTVVFVTSADLYLPHAELVARVRGALLAAPGRWAA